jgi:hypothetical protein
MKCICIKSQKSFLFLKHYVEIRLGNLNCGKDETLAPFVTVAKAIIELNHKNLESEEP